MISPSLYGWTISKITNGVLSLEKLITEAKKAWERAYVPYSKFQVGAALLTESGQIIHGCNVENASYGLTCCAERSAIFSAVSQGIREFTALAVVTNADSIEGGYPCGACRQVISEFLGKNTPIHIATLQGEQVTTSIGELLPHSFTLKP
jgi:cytidine deaminase